MLASHREPGSFSLRPHGLRGGGRGGDRGFAHALTVGGGVNWGGKKKCGARE